jgi:DAK2 domain fusion protein YloV
MYASTTWLTQNKEVLNALNVFPVPDGDTGTNMSLTLHTVLKEIEGTESNHLPEVASLIADSSLLGARGNSGVILSQILRGFAEGVGKKKRADSMDIALSLKISASLAYAAVDKPAEGTILTLIREVAETAVELAETEKDIIELLRHILETGEEILVRSKELLPELKRADVIDAGGKGFLFMIEGILKLIEGADLETGTISELPTQSTREAVAHSEPLDQRYCTSFVVRANGKLEKELRKKLENKGKDIVIASSGNVIKVHIHTNDPDDAIGTARKYGMIEQVEIDDMEEQYREFIASNGIGLIAVAAGDGLKQIFERLNAAVVEGGQTMNPSVSDLKSAIDQMNSEKVFLFPNNSNIIGAAKHAAELSEKEVRVIPSTTIPEGIATITTFAIDKNMDENAKRMESSLASVKSGAVTKAVRDAELGESSRGTLSQIKEGDYIGIHGNDIGAQGNDADDTLFSLLRKMVDAEDSIISIFHNNKDEDMDQLSSSLSKAFPDLDVEIYYGGQPHYDYIISVE